MKAWPREPFAPSELDNKTVLNPRQTKLERETVATMPAIEAPKQQAPMEAVPAEGVNTVVTKRPVRGAPSWHSSSRQHSLTIVFSLDGRAPARRDDDDARRRRQLWLHLLRRVVLVPQVVLLSDERMVQTTDRGRAWRMDGTRGMGSSAFEYPGIGWWRWKLRGSARSNKNLISRHDNVNSCLSIVHAGDL